MTWGFIPQAKPGDTGGPGLKPKDLVVNADEGEPGTCKDTPLMMADPHSLIEGAVITAYAIQANCCAIYVRGEILHCIRRLQRAVDDARAAGYLGHDILGSGFDLEIVVPAAAPAPAISPAVCIIRVNPVAGPGEGDLGLGGTLGVVEGRSWGASLRDVAQVVDRRRSYVLSLTSWRSRCSSSPDRPRGGWPTVPPGSSS